MTVVVTGAAGFVGSAVVRELRRGGQACLGIDRRPGPDGSTDLVGDLLAGDPAIEAALRDADGVLHLAARAGVRDREPGVEAARRRDNVHATARVLALVPAHRPVVVSSSSSVYGGAHGRPCHEDDPLTPRGGYARSKVAVEGLCSERAAAGGQVTVARPFTVIGEGQRPDMALSRWAAQARAGRPLLVLGSLLRTRDVTDVRTVAAVLIGLLELGGRRTVNVGSGRPRTLAELVDAVAAAVGTPVDVVVRPAGAEEPPDTHADTTRLHRLVGRPEPLDLADAVARAVGTAPALVRP